MSWGIGDTRCKRAILMAMAALAGAASEPPRAAQLPDSVSGRAASLRVVGDGIPEPIGAAQGDAERGRALILARDAANCVLCHALPDPGVRFAGTLGPSLDGVARRFSIAQLRLRVADNLRLNPATIMPSYYRVDGLDRV